MTATPNPDSAVPTPAPETAPAGETPAAPAPAVDPLHAAQAECEALQQKWLLAQADLENYRRRVQKELEQERTYRSLPLARDLLAGLDNLRRAVEASKTGNDLAQLTQGVQMVLKQFEDVFANHSIKPIESVGQPFDPKVHEAIQQVPNADQPPMTVMNEFQKGYMLHDRIVRPSVVSVSVTPPT